MRPQTAALVLFLGVPAAPLAPGFDATGYSIELSEGVGNSVPEPGEALLTSAGAAVLLLLRRRRPSGE